MYVILTDPSGNIFFIDDLLTAVIIGSLIGGITAEIYGGDFGQGFAMGAATAAIAFVANEFLHNVVLKGLASWYPKTGYSAASGEPYDESKMTAAMHKVKFGTTVTVEYEYTDKNGEKVTKSLQVIINDRGPWEKNDVGKFVPHSERIIDLTPAAFEKLAPLSRGVIPVKVTVP